MRDMEMSESQPLDHQHSLTSLVFLLGDDLGDGEEGGDEGNGK